MKIWISFALIATFMALTCQGCPLTDLATEEREARFVKEMVLNRDFDMDVRPPNPEGATVVNVSMFVYELDLDKERQEMTLSGYLRQRWNDPRLKVGCAKSEEASKKTVFQMRDVFKDRKIWVPDTFIVGDKYGFLAKVDPDTGARSGGRIFANGDVLTSLRMRVSVPCAIDDSIDELDCGLAIESYWYKANEVAYRLMEQPLFAESINDVIAVRGWKMESKDTSEKTLDVPTGKYSRLDMKFSFISSK